MEIAIILFFLAIFLGAIFLGVLIFVLYKILQRRKKQNANFAAEDEKR